MSAKQVRQPRPLASEPSDRGVDSPYLTADEACVYLRYASVGALYQAVRTHQIPVCRRGRSLLFHRGQLDRWLAGERSSELRREARHSAPNVAPFSSQQKPTTSESTERVR